MQLHETQFYLINNKGALKAAKEHAGSHVSVQRGHDVTAARRDKIAASRG